MVVKEYSNEGLVSLALELHSRALAYGNKEQHDRAMEARIELIDRLEKGCRQPEGNYGNQKEEEIR